MASDKAAARRHYAADFKAQVVAQCDGPGASVAMVAMSHGVNASVVHRWRQLARQGSPQPLPSARAAAAAFVPLALPGPGLASALQSSLTGIHVELRRGQTVMSIKWPANAPADFTAFAAFACQVLR